MRNGWCEIQRKNHQDKRKKNYLLFFKKLIALYNTILQGKEMIPLKTNVMLKKKYRREKKTDYQRL